MNKISKNLIIGLVAVITLIGCVYAGRVEYNDTVFADMGLSKFEYVKRSIGGGSRSDVIQAYVKNRSYYDIKYKEFGK